MNHPSCPKCNSPSNKNAKKLGKQSYKCKMCSYQFTRLDKAIKPRRITLEQKIKILILAQEKKSLRVIAKILGTNRETVSQLIKNPWTAFKNEPIIQSITDKSKLKLISVTSKDEKLGFSYFEKNTIILKIYGQLIAFELIA